ncbi:TRAP transporter small permease [Uliginosibacterium sp. H3]|uniref:TRAP transporter small permease protein n=1 Tax=Uliginosibacterium silvisoli TaxID=3114758 RepID=A0ABU6K388_9RHOO|nr:TRAP transporter small permease [Uliginosibacterium sp. H3]
MLTRFINGYCRLLDWVVAAMLAIMVVLVFGNVVLRYAFNTGISLSEELSRWLFVWTTFLGAVVALNERRHLGTDFVVATLPRLGKKLCLGISYVLMLYACWLMFSGALAQVRINMDTTSAVMEAPVAWFYASGMVFSVLASLIILRDLIRLLSSKVSDAELIMIQESEDLPSSPHAGEAAR